MSMSTEEALSYFSTEDKKEETPAVETKTPSVEVTKSEEINVDSPDKSAKPNDGSDSTVEVKTETSKNDEPAKSVETKADDIVKEDPKKEDQDDKKQDQRDYAFIRQKNKNKELKKQVAERDTKIKELEAVIEKYKNLKSDDFKKEDGSVNVDAFTNWKLQERDIQNEIQNLKNKNNEDELQAAVDYDRYVTEQCFQGQELEDYNKLMLSDKVQSFTQAINEVDPEHSMFNYLDTLSAYPVVLRELITNPNPYLGRIFRSKDPEQIRKNTAFVADIILDEYTSKKKSAQTTQQTQQQQPAAQPVAKTPMPVIGKQIAQSQSVADTDSSLLKSMDSINKYLAKSKHRAWS